MSYLEQLEAAGHVLKREADGDIDIWVLESGYCNGPGCVNCGESWCHHCEDSIRPCIGKEAADKASRDVRYELYLELKQEFG